jgi:hypothetical protein
MLIHTVPTSRGAHSRPSSVKILIVEIGHALPTVPGLLLHSSGRTSVPPPSDAA